MFDVLRQRLHDNDRIVKAKNRKVFCLQEILKQKGFIHVMTMGRNSSLLKIHKELGWTIDPTPSHEIIKNL